MVTAGSVNPFVLAYSSSMAGNVSHLKTTLHLLVDSFYIPNSPSKAVADIEGVRTTDMFGFLIMLKLPPFFGIA